MPHSLLLQELSSTYWLLPLPLSELAQLDFAKPWGGAVYLAF
jgi:hypothetical protein